MEKFLQKLSSHANKHGLNVYETCAVTIRIYQKYWKEITIAGLLNISFHALFITLLWNADRPPFPLVILIALLTSIVNSVLIIDLNQDMHGKHMRLTDSIKKYFTIFIPLLGVTILVDGIVILGLIALLIPGIILFLMFGQATYFVLFEQKGPIDALTASRNLTKGKRWGIFYFYVVMAFFYLLTGTLFGLIPFVKTEIGELTGSFGAVATFVLWRQLKKL